MKPIRDSDAEISGSFVAVDINELSQQLTANTVDHPSSSPRVISVMKKNLSRKQGSSKGSGAERERNNKTVEGDERHATGGPAGGDGSSSPTVHLTVDGEAAAAEPTTPDGRRWRRVGTRRSASPWLNPSSVVIFFATLSSMGTLLLLYFTISRGEI